MSDISTSRRISRREFLQSAGAVTTTAIPWGRSRTTFAPLTDSGDPPPRPMRSPSNAPRQSGGEPGLPPVGIIALNRLGMGARPGDLAAFDALGATDEDRLFAYIDQQLDPTSIDDPDFDARMTEAAFTTLDKSLEQLWTDHIVNYGGDYFYRSFPLREVERAAFVRAVYSTHQLVEVLADFWHNHFNVNGWEYPSPSVFVHYDRDVIRAHMLGNFREMLEAVATSTAMLYYLDNYVNRRQGPNENWSRELLELHTLGAENYFGVMDPSEVPLDAQGLPIGFVDDDIIEAARCFTGWAVANSASGPAGNTGLFLYRDDWHDLGSKRVLGIDIPADQDPMKDGRDVLDAVASHPGAARHICSKLCRRLINDEPPASVVASAADVFLAQQGAPDQLKQVVRHILRSVEFRTTWGQKVKRPLESIVSALRATAADFTIMMGEVDSDSFMNQFDLMGQAPYAWIAPDGYPDVKGAWQGTTPLAMRWRMLSWLVTVTNDAGDYRLDVLGQAPVGIRSPNALADFWIERILGRPMPDRDRTQIVELMAQGRNPDFDLALDTDTEVQDRLRAMVATILMSPEFQWR